MIIEYNLPQKTSSTNLYFTKYIISHIRYDIIHNLDKNKIKIRLDYINSSNFIRYHSGTKLHVDDFLIQLADSIQFKRFRNNYIIRINPHKCLDRTSIPISVVARLIDKGDSNIRGCYQFSQLFLKYQKNIYTYYKTYCLLKQLNMIGGIRCEGYHSKGSRKQL